MQITAVLCLSWMTNQAFVILLLKRAPWAVSLTWDGFCYA